MRRRLFVALTPPPHINKKLLLLGKDVPGMRWIPSHNLHLTLRFLGHQPPEMEKKIIEALHKISAPRPTVDIQGVGRFGPKRTPHAVWAGVGHTPALESLHIAVDDAALTCGLTPDKHDFIPHITLGRANPKTVDTAAVEQWLQVNQNLSLPPFEAADMMLFSSEPSPTGSIYQTVEVFPLGA